MAAPNTTQHKHTDENTTQTMVHGSMSSHSVVSAEQQEEHWSWVVVRLEFS